jgi:hypothetical protein
MTDVAHDLFRETRAAKTLLAQLADIIGDDQQAAADLVEGETSLNEAIDAAVQKLVEDTAAVRGLKSMIEDLTRRQVRLEERIKNFRTALSVALEQAGRKSVEHPAVTISLRAVAASVAITDEAAVPSRFWKAGEPRLDKHALLEALKAKELIPGVSLSNGRTTLALTWS